MLQLYGHPFAAYAWKALIALYAYDVPFTFRLLDPDHPENLAVLDRAGPLGKFPVLEREDGTLVYEAICILEWLALNVAAARPLLPEDPLAALPLRHAERVIDSYVLPAMQAIVDEHLRVIRQLNDTLDLTRIAEGRERLERAYGWLENWLCEYERPDHVTIVECTAVPALFYADWCHPIGETFPRLRDWRAHLLALPPAARVIDEARPFRAYFPLGAPDRD